MLSHSIIVTRTIYDPATKNFVFKSNEDKAMPNIRQWIEKKNPVIYWYILRIDNSSELMFEQWAVELYTHQALSITNAYIDGNDRLFELRKRELDPWNDKYVLSIPRQIGIPIVESGNRRIFFKVDINCREGLMHEYGIAGKFITYGIEGEIWATDIREKKFHYSCKVGEFQQIFDINPDEASVYAEKRLLTRYSPSSVSIFTNSFRIIHDLYKYCNTGSIEKDNLMHQLRLMNSNFEKIPEIAGARITPLINNGIKELSILNMSNLSEHKSQYIQFCNSIVELLHLEVVSSIESHTTPSENFEPGMRGDSTTETGQLFCPVCKNLIDSSNHSLLCGKCDTQLCQICESWFREERKRGEMPLCKKCFTYEPDQLFSLEETERRRDTTEGEKGKTLQLNQKEEEELRRQKKEKKTTGRKAKWREKTVSPIVQFLTNQPSIQREVVSDTFSSVRYSQKMSELGKENARELEKIEITTNDDIIFGLFLLFAISVVLFIVMVSHK